MNLSKSTKIILFESMVSFFLIYFNWIACSSAIQNRNNFNMIISLTDFALIFMLLFVTSYEYFATFNPVVTILLYIFKQIDLKRVSLPGQTAPLGTSHRHRRRSPPSHLSKLPFHQKDQRKQHWKKLSYHNDVQHWHQRQRTEFHRSCLLAFACRPAFAHQAVFSDSSLHS